ncbi:hypothetical protein [Marinilabilia salmonicolor]|uniref:hypothetical protein n=1 Tax=Marinilabilia salmonicolor TaxID=989 RepID=UPI00029A3D47|nr:hypothetical protein [Marinilabilia salmonicolor]
MFQLGLFTTHLPYILIIAFSAWAFLFNSAEGEDTESLCHSFKELSTIPSSDEQSFLIKNIDTVVIEKSQLCQKHCLKQTERNTIIPLSFSLDKEILTSYFNRLSGLILPGNNPDRAPPGPLHFQFA